MRKKWERYGRVAGQIVLTDATDQERQALTGILGKSFCGEQVKFAMAEFENALQKTRFAPVTLETLLEDYFGERICTNQEKTDRKTGQREEFLNRLEAQFRSQAWSGWGLSWIRAMRESGKHGYSALMSQHRKNPENAFALAKNVGMCLEESIALSEAQEERPLAVLAAEMTNNPHYLDRGTAAGSLLMHAICWYKDCDYPQSAYLWRLLLLEMGICPDNLSSSIAAYGIHFRTEQGLHPAYEAFYQSGESGILTMEHMKRITGAYADDKTIYIVENQMVFSYLVNRMQRKGTALLCTSGQLRSAAQELIRMLVQSGMQIYYSGDIDPEGMLIADKLWQKYPEQLHIWRMSKQDYKDSISEEKIAPKRLTMLELLRNPCLQETAYQVRKIKKAGYQENILQSFVKDMEALNDL
jgi:uncharacterized protein (TIGR02679 family)